MANINFKLFGNPIITENGKEIYLPPGKVSALLYYILLKKVVSRDEAAAIFWGRSNENRAKVSLRNAIYKIKRAFGEDVIETPNKTILSINDKLDVFVDVIEFEKDPTNNLNLYKGDFLGSLYIKDCTEFEYWVLEQKNYYKDMYIKSIKSKIEKDYKDKSFSDLENNIMSLISLENFDEFGYLYLFKIYQSKGRYDKIINEYYNLKNILEEELGIEPSDEIQDIYKEALKYLDKQKKSKDSKIKLYDRNYEIERIQRLLEDFNNNISTKSILLFGESGIGKTTLKKEILENNKDGYHIFEVQCYSLEKIFSYSPWLKLIKILDEELSKKKIKKPELWGDLLKNLFYDTNKLKQPMVNILESREDFNLDLIYLATEKVLKLLSFNKKTIIVFEDLQFMDKLSAKLFVNMLLQGNENFLFFNIISNEIEQDLLKTINMLKELNKIELIELEKFSKMDVGIILQKSFKGRELKDEDVDNIYNMSKGNALLLNEYIELYRKNENLETVSPKMNSLLQTKFAMLGDIEKEILSVVSAFYGDVNINNILNLLDYKAFDVVNGINNLTRLNILEERNTKNGVFIYFTNSLYKNYIYNGLSEISKQVIHAEIAKMIDVTDLRSHNDVTTYIKLKYHYEQAKDKTNTLKYEIYILNYYLNFNHEVYPSLDDYDVSRQVKNFINNNEVLTEINSINDRILVLKNEVTNEKEIEEIKKLELIFLYCKGRYLIRAGEYKDGVKVMKRVIDLAEAMNDYKTKLQGNKQMVIYGIQINDTSVMLSHIIDGIKDAKTLEDNLEIGIMYRLYGVYYTMNGNLKQAEDFFNRSIETITKSGRVEHSSSISVAANYNYIGEIRNSQFYYEDAMNYFKRAIELSEYSGASCLSIFYINAAKTSFFMDNADEMKEYLKKSKEIVRRFDSYWKAPVLDAFLSLSSFIDKDYAKSLNYLKNAIGEVKTINNPKDIGEIYFVKTILRKMIDEQKNDLTENVDKFLNQNCEYYYYRSMEYLDKYKNRAEIKYLEDKIMKRG